MAANEQAVDGAAKGLARWMPILSWLPSYNRAWLRPDLIAGLTVAALVIPKSLGYAGIAGVPVQYGLYACAAGALIYPFFGTSRQIATGPSSALAAVAAGAVVAASVSGDDAVTLVASITLASGLLFLLFGVLKLGWISQFLSKAVITGFLFGAAIQVVIGELGGITGTDAEGSNSWRALASWIEGLGDTDATTLIVGVVSLVVIFGLKFTVPRVPGALVLLVGGLIASAVLGLGDRGVALVGDVPRGLPSLVLPDLGFVADNVAVIVASAGALLLIGFSQTTGDARSFASEHRYQVDINQEAFAQGMANAGSGIFQGIPVSASLSSSALNDQSGAKTPLASLTTGALVILTLILLAPLFSDLPKPVLSALIIEAVVMGMMDVAGMRRLYRVKRSDFWIAVAALVGVLSAGVLAGVIIGVALSIGWLIYVSAVPSMPVMGRKPDSQAFRPVGEDAGLITYPGVLVIGFDAGLFFIDADSLLDRIRDLSHDADPPLTTIVIDFEGVNYIDSQGSAAVGNIAGLASNAGVLLRLARVKPGVRQVLERDGVVDRIGATNIRVNLYEALADRIDSGS